MDVVIVKDAIKVKLNSVVEIDDGIKVLITNKKMPIDIGANRMFLSADLTANFGNTKDNLKTYISNVRHQKFEIDGVVYGMGVFIIKHNAEAEPKPKPKQTKGKTTM